MAHKPEAFQNDRAVRAYLDSVVHGDYNTAYALVCTDETGVDRGSFERAEREDPIRSFEIESSGDWSSWVDGHGREYQVRVTRTMGAETVEKVSTLDANSICVQYAFIKRQ